MAYIISFIFFLSLFLIFIYSVSQLHLTWLYLKAHRTKKANPPPLNDYSPKVTIQLPVFNELYVAERILEAVSALDYPKDKMEIQVLDDSTDETTLILKNKVAQLKEHHFNIQYIHREDRKGFKAGALQNALHKAEGEFIAIFDVDFVPEKDFLLNTLPHFEDPKVAVVQTRWGHLNKNFSLLTKLQAFGLDAHFSIEQVGRSFANSFINFNGTGGVWRKAAIVDAGEWSDDTLTEDLDLSYRAQLKGWKFVFREDIAAPAELPVVMSAVKSQQFRWNKGAAENARKNLGKVLRSDKAWTTKVHAIFHLLNSSVFLCVMVAGLFSVPMLFIKNTDPAVQSLFSLGTYMLFGFFSLAFFYLVATIRFYPTKPVFHFLKLFPMFLIMSMGMALHNAYAVIEGLAGFKSPFIRTPKFNIIQKTGSWKGNIYINNKINLITVMEGVFFLYFLFAIVSGIYLDDYDLMIFHVMLTTGFASVFLYSVLPVQYG